MTLQELIEKNNYKKKKTKILEYSLNLIKVTSK